MSDPPAAGAVATGPGATAAAAPPVTSLRHPLTRTLVALTVTTGLVDAGSYLGLAHVFAANMTGNIVLLAVRHADRRDADLAVAAGIEALTMTLTALAVHVRATAGAAA